MSQKKTRGMERIHKENASHTPNRTTYLFAVGINSYVHTDIWPKLNNAVKDAQDVTNILQEKFAIQQKHTLLLLEEEATRENILDALYEYENQLSKQDNLIIYFSGHGSMDANNTNGYWIPVEARDKPRQYVPHYEILARLKGMQAHHVYIIADACFSGAMLLRSSHGPSGKDQQPSRRAFTSGEDEPVLDGNPGGNSPFTFEVLNFLESQTESFLCSDMENHVIKHMTGSKPLRNVLIDKKYVKGEMALHPKNEEAKAMERAWARARSTNTERAYFLFLREFPDSPYEAEAERLLELSGEEKLWTEAKRKGTLSAIRKFMKSHPGSPYLAEAQEFLDTLLGSTSSAASHELPFDMVHVDGGVFSLREGYKTELDTFYISTCLITQEVWSKFMEANPSAFPGETHPVDSVSWIDIQKFLQKLNEKYPDKYFSLPTEAQWEFAARGGNHSRKFVYAGSHNLDTVAWYKKNSGYGTSSAVGQKEPNELGIYDMSGNLWEWCQDAYVEYPTGKLEIPNEHEVEIFRVIRGGSYTSNEEECLVDNRYSWYEYGRRKYIGFRVVCKP